jgi:salicylate hydroxylase
MPAQLRILDQPQSARRERTAAVVRASNETRNRAFNHELADAEGVRAYLAREWERGPVMARYEKIYAYDATSVPI